jgi:hypothetical protein
MFYLNEKYYTLAQFTGLSTFYMSGTSTQYPERPPPDYACPDCHGYGETDSDSAWASLEPCDTCQGSGIMAIPMGEFWG